MKQINLEQLENKIQKLGYERTTNGYIYRNCGYNAVYGNINLLKVLDSINDRIEHFQDTDDLDEAVRDLMYSSIIHSWG